MFLRKRENWSGEREGKGTRREEMLEC